MSVHPYRPQPPETVIKDYSKLRELIKRNTPNGKKIPIISGEWGYSNINWDKARLTDDQQAQYLVREFLINLYQKIPVSIWYDWKNDGNNPDEREHHFGTVRHDLKPKTAYLAVKTLSSTLDGYVIVKRLRTVSEEDFAFLLKKGGNGAIATWTTDEEHQVILQCPAGKGTITDMLGHPKKISWHDDALKLTISQSPQYVLITHD